MSLHAATHKLSSQILLGVGSCWKCRNSLQLLDSNALCFGGLLKNRGGTCMCRDACHHRANLE